MKKFIPIIGVAIFPIAVLLSQVSGLLKTSPKGILAWDPPTVNEDGTPLTDLAGYRLAVSALSADLKAGGVPLATFNVADKTATQQDIMGLMGTLPAGDYRFWALAYDDVGNESAWCDFIEITYDPLKPGKPIKLRIK